MVYEEEVKGPRKLRRAHNKILKRVKKLINKSKKGMLVKVLAAVIAFSTATPIKAMEPETKKHFNTVAEYTIQMQDVVNNQLDFQIDSDQFKQAEIVVDSLKNLQVKEVSMALEGYFTDTFRYFLEGNSSQVERDIKALRTFAEEVDDADLQKGVTKWTGFMEGAVKAKNMAADQLSNANSHYDDMDEVNKSLKQAFKVTKEFGVLTGYISLNVMEILQKSANQIVDNAYNERYDKTIEEIDMLQHLFDQVPEKTDVYKEFVDKTKFTTITKILANATNHIESGSEKIAVDGIRVAKKIDKTITDYLMPTVLESMTKEIIRTADSGDYEMAKKQIRFLNKKFDSETAVKDVNTKIGNRLLKMVKIDFSRNNYKNAFNHLLEAEDFLGEKQSDLRKSMSHILEKKGQTELAKKFETSTSNKGFSNSKFWK